MEQIDHPTNDKAGVTMKRVCAAGIRRFFRGVFFAA